MGIRTEDGDGDSTDRRNTDRRSDGVKTPGAPARIHPTTARRGVVRP
jgi:hypothetical protein